MDDRVLMWIFNVKFSVEGIIGYFTVRRRNFLQYQENPMSNGASQRSFLTFHNGIKIAAKSYCTLV